MWIVDPIDGTREFIEGLPERCVSIGLSIEGEALAGGILNPMTNERIIGSVGTGVMYEGQRLPTNASSFRSATILASRFEVSRGEWDWMADVGVAVTPMGSTAYELALVTAGRADATWTFVPKHEWDVAAGVSLLASAGAHYRLKGGGTPTFNRPNTLLSGLLATTTAAKQDVESLLASVASNSRGPHKDRSSSDLFRGIEKKVPHATSTRAPTAPT